MTRIWLEKISEPFSLLVFDNHTDMQPPAFGGLLSCGGWIYDSVMELPLLKRVILIGPDEEAFSRVEPEIQEKVEFLSREKLLEMEEAQVCAFVSEHVGSCRCTFLWIKMFSARMMRTRTGAREICA